MTADLTAIPVFVNQILLTIAGISLLALVGAGLGRLYQWCMWRKADKLADAWDALVVKRRREEEIVEVLLDEFRKQYDGDNMARVIPYPASKDLTDKFDFSDVDYDLYERDMEDMADEEFDNWVDSMELAYAA